MITVWSDISISECRGHHIGPNLRRCDDKIPRPKVLAFWESVFHMFVVCLCLFWIEKGYTSGFIGYGLVFFEIMNLYVSMNEFKNSLNFFFTLSIY